MTENEYAEEVARVEELSGQLRTIEVELNAALAAAASAGASERDLAAAAGSSKTGIHRRLNGERPRMSVAGPESDGEEAEFRRALRAEQLKLARLRTAREATRLKLVQDAQAQLEEVNSMTRISPLDFEV